KKTSAGSLDVEQQIEFLSHWTHSVVFELIGADDFKSDPGWIARRLRYKITPSQVQASLSLLESLGLARFDRARGRHVKVESDVQTSRNVDGIAFAGFHQQMIDLARQAIVATPPEERDINALTLSLTASLTREAMKIVEDACAALVRLEQRP